MKSPYLMIINQQTASLFQYREQAWQPEQLNGETENPCATSEQLFQLLNKLDQRINLTDRLQHISLQIFCQHQMHACLTTLPTQLATLRCTDWAIHCLDEISTPEQIFSLAHHPDNASAEIALEETIPETNDALQEESHQLQAQIEQLKARLITMQKPPIAQLATFLPIIYKNFWQEVSETDLALLADTFELPEVPRQAGGVQEPSSYTIERKKKAFLALSEDEQTKILDFCRNTLPRTLTIRPEMQAFVEI